MLGANPDLVQRYPIATKRVLRAVIKATDLCMTEPERVARQIVDGGFTPRYDYALQTLTEVPYNKWREYDPEPDEGKSRKRKLPGQGGPVSQVSVVAGARYHLYRTAVRWG